MSARPFTAEAMRGLGGPMRMALGETHLKCRESGIRMAPVKFVASGVEQVSKLRFFGIDEIWMPTSHREVVGYIHIYIYTYVSKVLA